MRTELLQAIYTRDTCFLEGYLQTVPMDALVDDLQQLISGATLNSHLKDFTMAAMQGLLSASWYTDPAMHEQLAKAAVSAAKTTLSELQKQQS